MLFSSGFREGNFDMKGRSGRPCMCPFSNSFSLKYSISDLEVVCPESHRWDAFQDQEIITQSLSRSSAGRRIEQTFQTSSYLKGDLKEEWNLTKLRKQASKNEGRGAIKHGVSGLNGWLVHQMTQNGSRHGRDKMEANIRA